MLHPFHHLHLIGAVYLFSSSARQCGVCVTIVDAALSSLLVYSSFALILYYTHLISCFEDICTCLIFKAKLVQIQQFIMYFSIASPILTTSRLFYRTFGTLFKGTVAIQFYPRDELVIFPCN